MPKEFSGPWDHVDYAACPDFSRSDVIDTLVCIALVARATPTKESLRGKIRDT